MGDKELKRSRISGKALDADTLKDRRSRNRR
jgi:hypothetical protein